ncbi:hypothetical protein AXF42_Ash004759 [Apostasia shenzhenica]|uniref:Uncharacterized protein n=1 Tax=Apostasia shenzhenica TaxID=1088818 RepID=A0A2I0BHI9_9ASPA|nr:hypothetical protein AXF42_Ash004759 [Apostasia shenzhenica]
MGDRVDDGGELPEVPSPDRGERAVSAEKQRSETGGVGIELVEQIVSHLPVSVPALSEISEDLVSGDSPEVGRGEGEEREESQGPEIIPAPPIPGPDPEEAFILISIIHD